MIAVALAGLVAGAPFGVARAQEGELPAQALTVTKQAYWTRSLGNLAPKALTDHFPPTVVCLLAPEACGGALAGPTSAIDKQVVENQPEDKIPGGDALGPALVGGKDHLPTSVLAGARRYLSGLQFDLPSVPSGHRVSKFEIQLVPVDDFTFHFDSPGFRQAVQAALVLAGRRDAAAFAEEAKKVGNDDHPMVGEDALGVEACPIVGGFEWKAGSNQDAKTAPERDADERTGTKLSPKQVDCILGANGKVRDGKWVFDLTLAANAWADGKLPNNGILLRPVLPPNLAYGDPDVSTWDQVTFYSPGTAANDRQKPKYAFATKEKSKPVSVGGARTVEPQVLGSDTETFTETFGRIDEPSAPLDAPAPRVEEPPPTARVLPALSGGPITDWWVWLFLPMLLGGVYLTALALTAEPALVTAERAGAMTRLIEARRRGELT